ncbi:unnamed protein product [Penicillium viridicatum]
MDGRKIQPKASIMDSKPLSKDSMQSTWRTAPRSEWNISHYLLDALNAHPIDLNKAVPVHSKDEKIPYMPQWYLQRWVLFYSALPLLLHEAYMAYTGHTIGPLTAFNFYFFAFNATVIYQVHILRRLGHKYGFLDGDKHERDGVPDVGVAKMSWLWLPLEIGVYGIVLDFWFYWYHRLMHDVSYLWKYHRTHHLTKHPNPLLAAYADHEQEFFDMVGVPMMTYFTLKLVGLPMGFYEWWICHEYVAFTEVFGHSGLRMHSGAVSTLVWLLQLFGADIVIEDHDLHHRKGWRKSYNYGKQTRLWDRVFGTCMERIESVEGNVDYENTAEMPLF